MKARVCTACGSNELTYERGSFRCPYCGTVYVSESGSSRVSDKGRATISLSDDIEALLQKCRANPSKASRYANLILDIDPDNKEALRYL